MNNEIQKTDLSIFDSTTLPHIRYLASDTNSNPYYIFKKYIGDSSNLTKDKVYKFHKARFSPNRETPYKEYWVTKSDDGMWVRYEDTRKEWTNKN